MKLSTVVDLRSRLSFPIVDQGIVGCCVACSLAAAHQFLDNDFSPSVLFTYWNSRWLDQQRGQNAPSIDDGTTLYQGIQSMVRFGCCPNELWPFVAARQGVKPSTGCYVAALNHQTLQYRNVRANAVDMKTCLSANIPFVFGFMVYSSFMTTTVARTGVVPIPTRRDRLVGGHAVLCVGYDDARQVWICRNSWGQSWGDRGHFYLPYAYLTSSRLAGDMWVVQRVEE